MEREDSSSLVCFQCLRGYSTILEGIVGRRCQVLSPNEMASIDLPVLRIEMKYIDKWKR